MEKNNDRVFKGRIAKDVISIVLIVSRHTVGFFFLHLDADIVLNDISVKESLFYPKLESNSLNNALCHYEIIKNLFGKRLNSIFPSVFLEWKSNSILRYNEKGT